MSKDENQINRVDDIGELPKEVLEYIFRFLNPYNDFHSCRLVNRTWYRTIQGLKPRIKYEFTRALVTCDVIWESYHSVSRLVDITNRYAHSACMLGNSIYIFGGFTSYCTSFNDLWRLDLSTRQWQRVLATGSHPSPKGCSIMVAYNDSLILYGGMTTPLKYYREERDILNSDLHIFNTKSNKWTLILGTDFAPPGIAGQSVSVHDDVMIMFGGLVDDQCTNMVWTLDLRTMEWLPGPVVDHCPEGRYGHSQVAIDDYNLLIIGGCSTTPFRILQDMWLLNMREQWVWTKIDVGANEPLISSVWCHPICKVGNHIIGFTQNLSSNAARYTTWFPGTDPRFTEPNQYTRLDINVNGRRGVLVNPMQLCNSKVSTTDIPSTGRLEPRVNITNRRIPVVDRRSFSNPVLDMYAIDISDILSPGCPLQWHRGTPSITAPEDTIVYSLIAANGELVMFGGVQKKENSYNHNFDTKTFVVNLLHFIKAKVKSI